MKRLILLMAVLAWFGGTYAQINHLVTAQDFFYDPANLTITAGDTVTWEQIMGAHNVNGSTSTFPSNPESFSNGPVAPGTWTYSYVFNTPGVYDYQCDPHFFLGMVGQITVMEAVDTCLPPTGLTSVFTGTKFQLSWTPESNHNAFQVKGRPVGAGGFGNKNSFASTVSVPLGILVPDTTYEWKVRARCDPDDAISVFSDLAFFSTSLPVRLAAPEAANNLDFRVFPNPSDHMITIAVEGTDNSTWSYRIFNAIGALQRQAEIPAQSGTSQAVVYTASFNAGIYFIEVRQGDRVSTSSFTVKHSADHGHMGHGSH